MDNNIINFPQKSYIKLNDLGQGGLGKTVLLKDPTIDQVFVCKKLSPYDGILDINRFNRFVNEIKILYAINHPNIVRVFSYYLFPEKLTGYLLMEYVNGNNISDYISNHPQETNDLFIQTIRGFAHLEKHKILHRDIRPGNLLVSNDGILKIIDFGFGKTINGSCISKSITLNWPYSWPNELYNKIYDFRTEIFFIGCLFKSIIIENNLNDIFKFNSILDKMLETDYSQRIKSFASVLKAIHQEYNNFINFDEKAKKIYNNLADSLISVCSELDLAATYIIDTDKITESLNELIKKSSLENYLQDNRLLINCFIKANHYKYKPRIKIDMTCIIDFAKWWISLSKENKDIVLLNLSTRLDQIAREDANLPF